MHRRDSYGGMRNCVCEAVVPTSLKPSDSNLLTNAAKARPSPTSPVRYLQLPRYFLRHTCSSSPSSPARAGSPTRAQRLRRVTPRGPPASSTAGSPAFRAPSASRVDPDTATCRNELRRLARHESTVRVPARRVGGLQSADALDAPVDVAHRFALERGEAARAEGLALFALSRFLRSSMSSR